MSKNSDLIAAARQVVNIFGDEYADMQVMERAIEKLKRFLPPAPIVEAPPDPAACRSCRGLGKKKAPSAPESSPWDCGDCNGTGKTGMWWKERK